MTESMGRVVILKDYRMPPSADGKYGTLVGMKPLDASLIIQAAKELQIVLDDQTVIWGYQCDWAFFKGPTTPDAQEEDPHE